MSGWKGRTVLLHAVAIAALSAVVVLPAQAEPPRRVLSFNLCADQLVLRLADPEQIVGLSPFAADPVVSVTAEAAQRFPGVPARAEAVVALQPDLVLAGPIDRASIRRVLTALGLRVVDVDIVASVEAARAQVRAVAALLGHPKRGEALVAEIDAAEARLAAAADGRRRTALVVERQGYVAGPDGLAAGLLRAAGLVPPDGAPSGLGGFVPLEKLLMLNPDVIALYEETGGRAADQGALFLAHPALQARYPRARRLILPRRFALCGGPAIVAALDYLTQVLSAPVRR